MQTIIIVLNPGKLENPDMDLCYCIPDRIEEVSGGAIQDNGYDYLDTENGIGRRKPAYYYQAFSRRKIQGKRSLYVSRNLYFGK